VANLSLKKKENTSGYGFSLGDRKRRLKAKRM